MWRKIGLGKGGIDTKFVIVFEKLIVETCTRTLRDHDRELQYMKKDFK
jgi:hypothetical protein